LIVRYECHSDLGLASWFIQSFDPLEKTASRTTGLGAITRTAGITITGVQQWSID
jgi:hypothetical protein